MLIDSSLPEDAWIALSGDEAVVELPCASSSVKVCFEVRARDLEVPFAEKAVVAAVSFFDDGGGELVAPDEYSRSRRFGAFVYVDLSGHPTRELLLTAPAGTTRIRLALAPWRDLGARVEIANVIRWQEAQPTRLPVPRSVAWSELQTTDWVAVTRNGCSADIAVVGGQDYTVEVSLRTEEDISEKVALVAVTWWDQSGQVVSSRGRISSNANLGEYRYIHRTGRPTRILLQPPLSAVRGTLKLLPWRASADDLAVQRLSPLSWGTGTPRRLHSSARRTPTRDIRVALVVDEFTLNSFAPEFTAMSLSPGAWHRELEAFKPDLFICESAWSGADSTERPWRGRVYASENFTRENRVELFGILEYCREHGIPTIFWNKEDPSHYADRRHDFVRTALLFDHIFTTAIECVPRYREDYGHPSVHSLPFATQPRLFNPVVQAERTRDVVFAGSWYRQHPARSEAMAAMFDSVIDSGHELVIYNRHHGNDDENHQFPERYQENLRPGVSHQGMAALYKSSIFGLNLNTEVMSRTMFARRVFELMSSNTLVLSNHSVGIQEMFDDAVVFLDRNPEGLGSLTEEDIDDKRERALSNVLRNHTYEVRFRQIREAIGWQGRADPDVILATVVRTPEHAYTAVSALQYLSGQCDKLLLIVGSDVPALQTRSFYDRFNRGRVEVVLEDVVMHRGATSLLPDGSKVFVTSRPRDVSPDVVDRALLHSSYIDDPIGVADGRARRYTVTRSHLVDDVLVRPKDLPAVVRDLGLIRSGTYYLV